MNPSATTVSDLLNELVTLNNQIESTLLIGEKVGRIYEAGLLYNELRALVTKEYMMVDEHKWIVSIGNEWNAEVKRYRTEMGSALQNGHSQNLTELEDNIRDAIDDLLGYDINDMLDEDDDLV